MKETKTKILLIGASSYLGARLYFDLRNQFEITGTYREHQFSDRFIQLDITDQVAVEELISQLKPKVIIHAANNGSGGWCQSHPAEAVALNQTATQFIVDAANKIGSKLIYISSFAALNPVDIYGQTKVASEKMVQEVEAGWVVLRPSLILGFSPNTTNDRPFNRYLKNIDQQTFASYDTSWKFQPTYIGHISEVIEQAIKKNTWNQIVPIVIEQLTSRYQIGSDLLSQFEIEVDAKDEGMSVPVTKTEPKFFQQFGIKPMNYPQFIEALVTEIRQREKFKL